MLALRIPTSFHRCEHRVEFLPFHRKLLEVVDYLVLALSGYLLNLKAQVLKKLMHIEVPLHDKDTPPVTASMPGHKLPKQFEINPCKIVHLPINPTNIHPKESNLITIDAIEQEANLNLNLKLGTEYNPLRPEIIPTLPGIILRQLPQGRDDPINGQVIEHAAKPSNLARDKVPARAVILLLEAD